MSVYATRENRAAFAANKDAKNAPAPVTKRDISLELQPFVTNPAVMKIGTNATDMASFAAVTPLEIKNLLESKGVSLDSDIQIVIGEPIKSIGIHTVKVQGVDIKIELVQ